MSEEVVAPDLGLANYLFQRRSKVPEERADAEQNLQAAIASGNLAKLYEYVVPATSPSYDAALVSKMNAANEAVVSDLKAKIDEAEASEDDAHIIDAWTALGNFYCKVCDMQNAKETLRIASEKTAAVGIKIDIALTMVRMGLLYGDFELIAKELDTAQSLIDRGGDWERKNKYKTYRGVYLMSIRQFEEAAKLLIDSFATFTCTELLHYEELIVVGVVCGALVLDRVNLKKKIVDSPEVLSVLSTHKELEPISIMTNSLYTGDYATFLRALADVEVQFLRPSPYLAVHSAFYVREMRCRAYSQLLESYMSLNLRSMASTFGVSTEYLEADLARLIPQKKLNCVVDKVHGVIITNRPDMKNAQYQQLIKQGDALLTKLQKYGAAVRMYGSDSQN